MKKILLLLLCLIMIFSFAACGGGSDAVPTDNGSESGASDDASPTGEYFTFSTETFGGEAFTSDDVKDAKVVMVNMWEPWCGPCVNEMPDLEKLYQEYKDKGFMIIGAYTTDSGAADIVEKLGISYPIIKNCEAFDQFVTGYVPTTAFVDGEGNVIGELIVGGRSYEAWKEIIDEYLA